MSEQSTMDAVLRSFDTDAFLGLEYNEATETSRTLMRQGWVPVSTIEDFEISPPKAWTDPKTNQQHMMSPVLKLKTVITDEDIRNELNVADDRPLYFTIQIFLDLNEQGQLDFGTNRNILLGQLREAIDQNTPGEPWSFFMLRGCRGFHAKVAHKASKNNPDAVFEQVTMIAATPEDDA